MTDESLRFPVDKFVTKSRKLTVEERAELLARCTRVARVIFTTGHAASPAEFDSLVEWIENLPMKGD